MRNNSYVFIRVPFENPRDAVENYKKFYESLFLKCKADEEDVIQKQLDYLIDPYADVKCRIIKKQNSDEYIVELQSLCKENKSKLINYLAKTEKEYGFFNVDLKEKDYNFYTNLLSWYSLSIDTTDRVIQSLHKISREKNKRENYLKNYQHIDIMDEKNTIIYNYG